MEQDKQQRQGRWKLFLILMVCATPLIGSYFTYYVIKPERRTNYGTLLDARTHPMPELNALTLDAKPTSLKAFLGKWLMVQIDTGACAELCKKKLYEMRQLRLTQGKEMDRIERIWLITDEVALDNSLIREYDGTRMIRVRPSSLAAWLPTETDTTLADHLYIIDPLGNLVMRYPKNADPNKIKKDLAKLLKASSIG